MSRVVVTGIGMVTPLGNSAAEVLEGIKNSRCGIGEITRYDASDRAVKLAAEVKDYNPDDYFDKREPRVAGTTGTHHHAWLIFVFLV